MSKKRILFVDDEPLVLQGLQRMLRSMRDEWEMEFAEGGAKALERLAQAAFDVVVSDMLMPGMNGAALLAEVMQRHPHTVRIILSGHADKDLILKCVGSTHQYLSKPCDPDARHAHRQRRSKDRDGRRQRGPRLPLRQQALHALSPGDHAGGRPRPSPADHRRARNPRTHPQRHDQGPERHSLYPRSRRLRLRPEAARRHARLRPAPEDRPDLGSRTGRHALPGRLRHHPAAHPGEIPRQPLAQGRGEGHARARAPTGSELLANIPRLEGVANIVLYQNKNFDGTGFPVDSTKGE